ISKRTLSDHGKATRENARGGIRVRDPHVPPGRSLRPLSRNGDGRLNRAPVRDVGDRGDRRGSLAALEEDPAAGDEAAPGDRHGGGPGPDLGWGDCAPGERLGGDRDAL